MNICVKSNEEQRRETESTRAISTPERYIINKKIIYEVFKNLTKLPMVQVFLKKITLLVMQMR